MATPKMNLDALVEHADRCWKAECENAERLAARIRLMLSGLIALFGVGLFKIEWTRSNDVAPSMGPYPMFFVKLFVTLSVPCFVVAFLRLLRRRERHETLHASEHLSLPDEITGGPASTNDVLAKEATFAATWNAYLDLQNRNSMRARRIDIANRWFFGGLTLVISALLIYVWASGLG